ncbi:MAG: 4Fe-4S binding protein [bacterium]
MNSDEMKTGSPQKWQFLKPLLLTIPMALLLAMTLTGKEKPKDPITLTAVIITWVFLVTLFYLMMSTQKTNRYRAIFFTTLAVCFVFGFITNLIEIRGSMLLKDADMMAGETPFCHLVLPFILIPAILTKTIIFPGSLLGSFAPVATMVVIWLGASLALGRGWCSWACFFGGMDAGFAQILRKPPIKKIDRRFTLLPWAVLIGMALISAATLSPSYCEWLCPFKAVTEFPEVTSSARVIQTVIFFMLFLFLVVLLPILTGKRTQCSLFCPFAAFQSLTNAVNVFDVRIDPEKCVHCKKCIQLCPTLSIDEESLAGGRALLSCTKCGKCVDNCPKQAISFHVKGTEACKRAILDRNLFLYPAWLFGATFGGGTIAGAIARLFKLITTGSLF